MKLRLAGSPLPLQPGKPVGNIYYGACSWTDRTLIESGTFYPDTAKTATDRLSFYASAFPIVEVDATYYALPSERNAHLWVERTPPGFVFNIKAFGLFTHHPVVVGRLPAAVRELLPAVIAEKSRVYLRDIPEEAEKLIWETQAQALAPLVAAGKLGCVLFQFPHWFTARRAHIHYLEQLRDRSDWPLAIEFRGGGWMTDNYRARTVPGQISPFGGSHEWHPRWSTAPICVTARSWSGRARSRTCCLNSIPPRSASSRASTTAESKKARIASVHRPRKTVPRLWFCRGHLYVLWLGRNHRHRHRPLAIAERGVRGDRT